MPGESTLDGLSFPQQCVSWVNNEHPLATHITSNSVEIPQRISGGLFIPGTLDQVVNVLVQADSDMIPQDKLLANHLCGRVNSRQFQIASGLPFCNERVFEGETVQYVKDTLDTWNQEVDVSGELARLCGDAVPPLRKIKFYHLEVSFQDVTDEKERLFLNSLPTTYNLSRDAVDRLRSAVRKIIHDSETLVELHQDLQANP